MNTEQGGGINMQPFDEWFALLQKLPLNEGVLAEISSSAFRLGFQNGSLALSQQQKELENRREISIHPFDHIKRLEEANAALTSELAKWKAVKPRLRELLIEQTGYGMYRCKLCGARWTARWTNRPDTETQEHKDCIVALTHPLKGKNP